MFRGMSEPEVWIESERVKVLRGRIGGRVGEIALVFGAFLAAAILRGRLGPHLVNGAWLLVVFGAPFAAAAALRARRVLSEGAGSIGVTDGQLVIVQGRKRKPIPITELVDGRSSPRRNEVEIGLRGGGSVVAAVPAGEDAERLLVAAGLDASRRTMRFELGETTFLTWMTILLGPAAVFPLTRAIFSVMPMPMLAPDDRGAMIAVFALIVFVFLALFVLLFYLVRAAWGPAKLVVGADGIVVDRPLRDEFVPYSRLASVTLKHNVVVLLLNDGSRVRARARHLTDIQQGELRARIDAARAAFDRGEGDAGALSQLDRGGRALDAWRTSLRALLDRQGTYRSASLTREQLLAVLESPAASAERRLAAAVSLSAAGEPEIATRIRVAAEACARPEVRIALDGVADGDVDDAAIEAAIAEDKASMSRDRSATAAR